LLRLIWELRDYPVDDAWLRDSDDCQNWAKLPSDIRADCAELLNRNSLAMSTSRHADLAQLLARLLARREVLKAGRPADGRQQLARSRNTRRSGFAPRRSHVGRMLISVDEFSRRQGSLSDGRLIEPCMLRPMALTLRPRHGLRV
jgi:hypothetical protein